MSAKQLIDDFYAQGFTLVLTAENNIRVRYAGTIPAEVIEIVRTNKAELVEALTVENSYLWDETAHDYCLLPDDLEENEAYPRWQLLKNNRVIFECHDYTLLITERDKYATTPGEARHKKIRVRQNPQRLPLSYGANPANHASVRQP